jgi:hypothetical protein
MLEYRQDQYSICNDGNCPFAGSGKRHEIRKDQYCDSKRPYQITIGGKPGNAHMNRFCPRGQIDLNAIGDSYHTEHKHDPGSRHAEKASNRF